MSRPRREILRSNASLADPRRPPACSSSIRHLRCRRCPGRGVRFFPPRLKGSLSRGLGTGASHHERMIQPASGRGQLERLGIANANLHTWRHTFASYLMMRTGNIRAVQMLLGHKSIRTTEIYSHLSERHLHHVVGQLPGPKMGAVFWQNSGFAGEGHRSISQKTPKRP
jgi:integrase